MEICQQVPFISSLFYKIPRHGKGTWADPEALSLKNQWLQHLVLADPETESSGVRLRAVEGLAGVKFLDPDSFMGLAAEASALAQRDSI